MVMMVFGGTPVLIFIGVLLASALPNLACSQIPPRSFEPGEIIVGYQSRGDREQAVQQLNATINTFSIRGQKVENVQVQTVGISAVKLRISWPGDLREQVESDPTTELQMLQELATQIKNSDNRVKYAHPNWTLNENSRNGRSKEAPAIAPPDGADFGRGIRSGG